MRCTQTVESGAYVLGALHPAERAAYERHLTVCPECRYEVSDLAGLPGLLGRLDIDTALAVGRPATPPPDLLESVLSRATRERYRMNRRRRWQVGGASLAAACLALLVGIGVPVVLHQQHGDTAGPVVAAMSPAVDKLPVTALLGYTGGADGTDIEMSCWYDDDATYRAWNLVVLVYPRSEGPAQTVKSITAKPGDKLSFTAHTDLRPEQIDKVELARSDGTTLLVYRMT